MTSQYHKLIQHLDPENLGLGSQGASVLTLQLILKELDLYKGPISDRFETETTLALQLLQRQFDLEETGILDTPTWYALSFWAKPPQTVKVAQASFSKRRWLAPLRRLISKQS